MNSVKWLHNYLNSNGTYDNTIIMGPENTIYIPFDYEYITIKDVDVKTNLEIFTKNYHKSNIIIDSQLILTIMYVSMYFDDVLIYDITDNHVKTLIQFCNKKFFINESNIYNLTNYKNILLMYVFIKYFCKYQLIQWNISLILNVIDINSSIIGFNVQNIIKYIKTIKTNNNSLVKYEFVNIPQYIQRMQNFENNITIDSILYSLTMIETKYILI